MNTGAWHLPLLVLSPLAACGYQDIVATKPSAGATVSDSAIATDSTGDGSIVSLVPFSGLHRLTELGNLLLDQEDPTIPADELELFFVAPGNRSQAPPPGEVPRIFVCKRASPSDPWGSPVEVSELNEGVTHAPTISPSGLAIWFESNRSGGQGDFDIWTSTRPSRDAPWDPPTNVAEVNTAAHEADPGISQDQRTLLFGRFTDRNHLCGTTRVDLTSPWAPPHFLGELNVQASDGSPSHDGDPDLAANGLALYWGSSRDVPGGNAIAHLYRASRPSLEAPFGGVTPLFELNSAYDDQDPWISADERHILFASQREGLGQHHLYEAWRR